MGHIGCTRENISKRTRDVADASAGKDAEGRACCCQRGRLQAGSGQNAVQFARAEHRVHIRYISANLIAVAFDQAARNDQLLCAASVADLVIRHFQDRVDAFLLGRIDERAGVDDDDVGVLRGWSQLRTGVVQKAHHHLTIHQIFGAAERDKTDARTCRRRARGGARGCGISGDKVRKHSSYLTVHAVLRLHLSRVLRDVIPPTPPGPEGSNGNGLVRAQ